MLSQLRIGVTKRSSGQGVFIAVGQGQNFALGHAVKMQLMIVEFVIFSTSTVKRSRAFLRFSGKNNGLSCEYITGRKGLLF